MSNDDTYDADDLHAAFQELLGEVPEAENAIREYREHRQKQSLSVARHMTREKERLAREVAWEDLRRQLQATYLSDSVH